MTFQAAVFDMDGLLLDTERLCLSFFQQACKDLDLPYLEEVYLSIIGITDKAGTALIKQGYGSQLDYPALRSRWLGRYHQHARQQPIALKSGVVPLLSWLKQHKIVIGLATSTAGELARIKLKHAGILDYFSVLATGDEVTFSKPDPEIFLLAASRLGVEPRQCLAFEDSNNGVRSAVAAQMQVYQIPDLVEPSEEVLCLGHQVRPSLQIVLDELQQSLLVS